MPITQDRMLALVAAAEDYEQAWNKVRSAYNSIAENLQAERISLQQAWAELDFMFTSQLHLSDPINTLKTIARESAHFKATAKRNEKSARWQREKRGGRQPYSQEEVAERLAQYHANKTSSRKGSAKPSGSKLTSTDDKQVQADSELFTDEPDTIAPKEPDEKVKAGIEEFLALEEAKEAYNKLEQESGNKG